MDTFEIYTRNDRKIDYKDLFTWRKRLNWSINEKNKTNAGCCDADSSKTVVWSIVERPDHVGPEGNLSAPRKSCNSNRKIAIKRNRNVVNPIGHGIGKDLYICILFVFPMAATGEERAAEPIGKSPARQGESRNRKVPGKCNALTYP